MSELSELQKMQLAHKERMARLNPKPQPAVVEAVEPPPPVETPAPEPFWFSVEDVADRDIKVNEVIAVVSQYFGFSQDIIKGTRRHKSIAQARQIGMYLSRQHTTRSLPEIGRRFGNRDHTTIMHGVAKIKHLIRTDWEIAHDVAHIEARL